MKYVYKLIMLSCILSLSANNEPPETTNVQIDEENQVKEAVHQLFKYNVKIRALFGRYNGQYSKELSKVFKETVSAKVIMRKDMNDSLSAFMDPALDVSLKVGVNTFFDLQKAAYDAKKIQHSREILAEVEKIACDYLLLLAKYNLKKELAGFAKKHLLERQKDLQEQQARYKHGDFDKAEMAEFNSSAFEVETSYRKLQNDLCMLESSLLMYMPTELGEKREIKLNYNPDTFEPNIYSDTNTLILKGEMLDAQPLSIRDLESCIELEKDPHNFKSSAVITSEYALKSARIGWLSGVSVFTPKVEFLVSNMPFKGKPFHEKEKSFYKASLGVYIDLSPASFLDLYSRQFDYEEAKFDYAWERQKYEHDYSKQIFEVKSSKFALENIKLQVKSRKLTLDSALAQYKEGGLQYSKITKARADYYASLEKYYDACEKYASSLVEYMKITGQLREAFLSYIARKGYEKKK